MRLMFISPRPYGVIATPGTYLSVEAYSKFCEVLLVCAKRRDVDIIVYEKKGVFQSQEISFKENLPVNSVVDKLKQFYKNISSPPYKLSFRSALPWLETILDAIQQFRPHVVVLPAWKHAPKCILFLKKAFPKVHIFVEVKSPLLSKNAKYLQGVKSSYDLALRHIAGIIGPSLGMIQSAIPTKLTKPVLTHSSIINYYAIAKKTFPKPRLSCMKFIFVGSLEDVRKIDAFIVLLTKLPKEIVNHITVHIFGEGASRNALEDLVVQLSLDKCVHFLGVIPQEELLKHYQEYDVGLAWVPNEFFAQTPSLKLIEYCAAGLVPLATNNPGHKILSEKGFNIEYFNEDSAESFVAEITKLVEKGYEVQKLQKNVALAENHDYMKVVEHEILPFYTRILRDEARYKDAERVI